ncbi:hypothetical protein Pogu_2037 [Pyrobaculum oguniense TE7]|uniref:Uncharacterized protein n=1 Tax=Pyrobaculum oguniense (strain DSM 13380 / JCM 10595 / TE7) TaxID=698757 RepID=H6QB67_PYROT|nr:hypothetical protein Pogu_2037 [Pyrobaculum oguniense TE7]
MCYPAHSGAARMDLPRIPLGGSAYLSPTIISPLLSGLGPRSWLQLEELVHVPRRRGSRRTSRRRLGLTPCRTDHSRRSAVGVCGVRKPPWTAPAPSAWHRRGSHFLAQRQRAASSASRMISLSTATPSLGLIFAGGLGPFRHLWRDGVEDGARNGPAQRVGAPRVGLA